MLFVGDSEDDMLLLVGELQRAGYTVTRERVETRAGMADALDRGRWDMVLSEHALASFSAGGGLALLKERDLDLPFLIVSAAIGEEIAVEAIRSGVHDFILKGNLKRLIPAIERELCEAEARLTQRDAEVRLRQAAERDMRLAAIVESSDDAITGMGPDGAIASWNPGAERLYGYGASEVIGLPVAIVAPPGREDELHRLVRRVAAGEQLASFEISSVRKDGRQVDVLLTLSPILDARGEIVGVSGIGRDITERKRFETELRHLADHDALARNRMEARFTWGERVRKALAEDLFVLYQQPILSLRSGEVAQYEVLLRMTDGASGVIPPAAFLPTTERFGLISAIDRWVMRASIALMADLQAAGRELKLEINLSGRSIDDPDLPDLVEAELAATSVDPASLIFEITETAAIANMDLACRLATRLTDLGCRFALDDFGSGFSSFYYLKHLPLDYVKIDGEFIRELPRSPTDQLVVTAMVEIVRGMGMQTIAEFVGDDETIELLRALDVDYAQGYRIGEPAPAIDLLSDSGSAPAPGSQVHAARLAL